MTALGDELGWEQHRLAESMRAQRRRVEQALGSRPITTTATSDDGSVSVTVGLGGGLRAVRLTPCALGLGAEALSRAILAVAQQATARVNERAHVAISSTLGPRTERHMDAAGLSYDPGLAEDHGLTDDPLGRHRQAGGR